MLKIDKDNHKSRKELYDDVVKQLCEQVTGEENAGKAVGEAGKEVGNAAKEAGKEIGSAAKSFGKGIKEAFTSDSDSKKD